MAGGVKTTIDAISSCLLCVLQTIDSAGDVTPRSDVPPVCVQTKTWPA